MTRRYGVVFQCKFINKSLVEWWIFSIFSFNQRSEGFCEEIVPRSRRESIWCNNLVGSLIHWWIETIPRTDNTANTRNWVKIHDRCTIELRFLYARRCFHCKTLSRAYFLRSPVSGCKNKNIKTSSTPLRIPTIRTMMRADGTVNILLLITISIIIHFKFKFRFCISAYRVYRNLYQNHNFSSTVRHDPTSSYGEFNVCVAHEMHTFIIITMQVINNTTRDNVCLDYVRSSAKAQVG